MIQKSYCENCGMARDGDDRFCPQCGADLGPSAPSAVSAADVPPGGPYAPPSGGLRTRPKGLLAVAAILVCCVIAGLVWWYAAGRDSQNNGAAGSKDAQQQTKSPETGPVATADEALARLQTLPAIKRWQSEIKSVRFEVMEEANRFVIRVFELVQDDGGAGHTAVLGWFSVDKQSGKAVSIDDEIVGGVNKLADPRTYLPQPNMKYTAFRQYADGDRGTTEIITAKVSGTAIVSAVEIVQIPGEQPTGFVQHFLEKQGVIYTCFDNYLDELDIWLNNGLYAGMQWEQYGISKKVVALGVPCDVGFRVFQDCLQLEVHNTAVGVHYQQYYAPGHGLILEKGLKDGPISFIVQSAANMDAKAAEGMVKRYAPNRALIKK